MQVTALYIAAAAAAAALLNAVASLVGMWRDNRWLKMTLTAQSYGSDLDPETEMVVFDLSVMNPARSENLIHSVEAFVDGVPVNISITSKRALTKAVKPFGTWRASFTVDAALRENDFRELRLEVRPVRGRRRRFRFLPTDLSLSRGETPRTL